MLHTPCDIALEREVAACPQGRTLSDRPTALTNDILFLIAVAVKHCNAKIHAER